MKSKNQRIFLNHATKYRNGKIYEELNDLEQEMQLWI